MHIASWSSPSSLLPPVKCKIRQTSQNYELSATEGCMKLQSCRSCCVLKVRGTNSIRAPVKLQGIIWFNVNIKILFSGGGTAVVICRSRVWNNNCQHCKGSASSPSIKYTGSLQWYTEVIQCMFVLINFTLVLWEVKDSLIEKVIKYTTQ